MSVPVWNFPVGYALATVFANGIPSTSSIVNISVPIPATIQLTSAAKLADGSYRFAFTNTPGAVFSAVASSSLTLPLSSWTVMGGVTEISPGQFQFTDLQASNAIARYYRVRSL
jgi:hypothetical protein